MYLITRSCDLYWEWCQRRLEAAFAEREVNTPPDELASTIEGMAYAAVKYADLKGNRVSNYK